MEQDEILGQNHDVYHEFPEHKDQIDKLKTTDPEFLRLFDEYTELNREVIRVEQLVEPRSHEFHEILKKKRLHAKDKIYKYLNA